MKSNDSRTIDVTSLWYIFITRNDIFQGQKGEPGSSLTKKHPGGIFKFDDVPAFNCTLNTAGTVRYNVSQNALQFCDGRSWLFLLTAPVADTKKVKKGHESQNPGRHCLDILNAG